jgi:PAS domain-containing protein
MYGNDRIITAGDYANHRVVFCLATGVAPYADPRTEKRIKELEGQHEGMTTFTKFLSYQKGSVESVLESMPGGVIIMDEVGTETYANQKLESLIGVTHHANLGG